MFLTEYDQEKVLEQAVHDDRKRVAVNMLMEKLPLSLITKISKLSEDTIRRLANNLGVTVI